MGEQYLSEIRIMSFGFAPRGWAQCNGQTVAIAQNQALFALLGTTYGGDGQSTFGIPNLLGSAPMHVSNTHGLGQKAGAASVTLTAAQNASHTHTVQASSAQGDQLVATNNVLAPASNLYGAAANLGPMSTAEVGATGGQPHENRQPFLALNFCIALSGIFPSRN